MTPWLQDPDVTLYHGDCLQVLRELPSSSVHMCATSPPFYGLRDYGTGEWEGGQPDCDHIGGTLGRQDAGRDFTGGGGNKQGSGNPGKQQFRETCGKCGARRVDKQIGLEDTPDQWVERLVQVFREVRRVLRDDGTLWVEIGDSYMATPTGNRGTKSALHGAQTSEKYQETLDRYTDAKLTRAPIPDGLKQKDLLGQPWLLAFALRADGWWLRSEIIWARPNPMPESVTDRPTKSHSTVFLLSKQPRYFYDADAIREAWADHRNGDPGPARTKYTDELASGIRRYDHDTKPQTSGANARSVWTIPTQPTPYAHFATWPEALVRRMILAGSPEGGTILDPFAGSATTNLVARNHGRHSIGIELNENYLHIAGKRLQQLSLLTEGAL